MDDPKTVHNSVAVANDLIRRSVEKHGQGLDSLQVLKLTYISHGFTLAILDKPLIQDDIMAWKYGPVIRRIYDVLPRGNKPNSGPLGGAQSTFDDDEDWLLSQVIENYGVFSGIELSTLTHEAGTPWKITIDRWGQNAIIPQDLIQEYYRELVARG